MARLRQNEKRDPIGGKTGTSNKTDGRTNRYRISADFRRNDDGSLNVDHLTDHQRKVLELVKEAIGPAAGGGVETPPPPPPPPEFPPQVAAMMLNVLIQIETAVVAPRMDLEPAAVRSALTPIPPIAEGIRDAAGRVMNKYAGALGAYADEIALCSLLITWQASAFSELRRLKAEAETQRDKRPLPPDIHESIDGKPFVMPPKAPEPPKAPANFPFRMAPAEAGFPPTPAAARVVNGAPAPELIEPETAADHSGNPFYNPEDSVL